MNSSALKKIFFSLLIVTSLLFTFTSCPNITGNKAGQTTSDTTSGDTPSTETDTTETDTNTDSETNTDTTSTETDIPSQSETNPVKEKTIWDGNVDLKHWNGEDSITIPANKFSDITDKNYLELTISKGAECTATDCTNNYSTIQIIASWNGGENGGLETIPASTGTNGASITDGCKIDISEVVPSNGTTTITYKPASWDVIKQKGIIIFGHKVVITSIKIADGNMESETVSSELANLSSINFAKRLTVGWNLGNTLDAHDSGAGKTNKGLGTETSWGIPETTKAMIDAVSSKGFKTIRIPVSWHNHITDDNYTIDSNWMSRVKTIVDWAIENEMFVILNVHHDDLTQSEMNSMYGYCVDLDSTLQTKSKAYLTSVWTQIAATFASYDEHLVFEALNEPRYRDGENNGFAAPENLSAYNAVISDYETSCISAIRAVKGNSTRFIMVPYYAAAPYEFAGWTLPEDSATDKLLVSTHAYSPYAFAMYDGTEHTVFSNDPTVWDDDDEIKLIFSTTMNNAPLAQWLNNGIGVVMGEASASDKDNYSERLKWIQSYFTYAQEAGVPVILWDNQNTFENKGSNGNLSENHGWLNRTNCTWFFPELVEEMISTARGQ